MGDVIPFPRDVVSVQIGGWSRLHTGAEIAVYTRDEDDGTSVNFPDGRLVIDVPIFPADPNMPIPAMFDPYVVTMTAAEARILGGLLIEAADTAELDADE